MWRILAAVVVLATLACGGTTPWPAAEYQRVGDETARVVVTPAAGGTITLSNGTKLEVPPGAVPADVTVTMRRLDGPANREHGALTSIVLEPHDIRLGAAATLSVPYDPAVDPASLGAVVSSLSHEEVAVGGELSRWQAVPATFDAGLATVALDHFSLLQIMSYPWALSTLDIPPKYLKNGDILFALTSSKEYMGASSFPIHVGVFEMVGKKTPMVVESTVPDKGCTDGYFQGVALNAFGGFRDLCSKHIYLGARRPKTGWTAERGQAAVTAAEGDIGKPYGLLGVLPPGGMTCCELAEDAWEDAGINLTWIPDELLTPWDQYLRTDPVKRIEVRADEKEVRIPVILAFRNENKEYDAAGMNPPFRRKATLTLESREDHPFRVIHYPARGERLWSQTQAFAEIVFVPEAKDAGQVFTFDARIGDDNRVLIEDDYLEIEVKPVESCPWTGQTWGMWGYSGTLTGTANGRRFSIADTTLSVSRAPSGELWVFTNTSQYGKEGASLEVDGGLFAETQVRDPVFSAGTAHSWRIDSPHEEAPAPDTHAIGPTHFECQGAELYKYEPGPASTMELEVSGDCQSITMRITAAARVPLFEDEGPGCTYEASITATRQQVP